MTAVIPPAPRFLLRMRNIMVHHLHIHRSILLDLHDPQLIVPRKPDIVNAFAAPIVQLVDKKNAVSGIQPRHRPADIHRCILLAVILKILEKPVVRIVPDDMQDRIPGKKPHRKSARPLSPGRRRNESIVLDEIPKSPRTDLVQWDIGDHRIVMCREMIRDELRSATVTFCPPLPTGNR